jgi:hypothetical protein
MTLTTASHAKIAAQVLKAPAALVLLVVGFLQLRDEVRDVRDRVTRIESALVRDRWSGSPAPAPAGAHRFGELDLFLKGKLGEVDDGPTEPGDGSLWRADHGSARLAPELGAPDEGERGGRGPFTSQALSSVGKALPSEREQVKPRLRPRPP